MTSPSGRMPDVLDKLARDVKTSTIETCAKVAELYRIGEVRPSDNQYQLGYNAAVEKIAAKIRELNK